MAVWQTGQLLIISYIVSSRVAQQICPGTGSAQVHPFNKAGRFHCKGQGRSAGSRNQNSVITDFTSELKIGN
jgi:hypothetical protein